MKIIIASSGSGGHLFCGLSIAEELKKKIPESKMFFLGLASELVRKVVEGEGFKFYKIYTAGFTGKNIFCILKFLIGQVTGILQSGLLIMFIRPRVVISTGGFVSTGIVLWSWILRIPCVVHEQNIIPGKANKFAGRFAGKILVSFEDTKKYFRVDKCIFTGMPMRFKGKIPVRDARKELGLSPDLYTVLVMGGSKGAHSINTVLIEMAGNISRDVQFIHLTGIEDVGFVKEAYKKFNFNSYVEAFSNKMDVIYSASSLVISRAGSGSISEITFFGLPSILVPYPYSKDRHQYKNADFIADRGAAIVITEDKLFPEILTGLINIEGRIRLQEMANKSKEIAHPHAVEKIVDEIIKIQR